MSLCVFCWILSGSESAKIKFIHSFIDGVSDVVDPAPSLPANLPLDNLDGRVQVLYFGAVDTGSLSGQEAVMAAVDTVFDRHQLPTHLMEQSSTNVDMCLTAGGVLLCDNLRK